MTSSRPLYAALVLSLFGSTTALADWRDTRWGQSVDDVIASVGGNIRKVAGKPDQRIWNQDWKARADLPLDTLTLETGFYFDRKGALSLVKMEATDPATCDKLPEILRNLHGVPFAELTDTILPQMPSQTAKWADRAQNLAILSHDLKLQFNGKRYCHVIYQSYGKGMPGMRK